MKLAFELDTSNRQDLLIANDMLSMLVSLKLSNAEADAPVIPQSIRKAPENKAVMAAPERTAPTSQQLVESIDAAEQAEAAPAPAPAKPKKDKPKVAKTVTIDEVRAIMVELSKKGPEEMDRQRTILSGMGFVKLSDVPPEKLTELKEKIEAA